MIASIKEALEHDMKRRLCICTQYADGQPMETGCGYSASCFSEDYTYCPYCGKVLALEEDGRIDTNED